MEIQRFNGCFVNILAINHTHTHTHIYIYIYIYIYIMKAMYCMSKGSSSQKISPISKKLNRL